MVAKLDGPVTFNVELQLIKLHDPSMKWFFEIASQIKCLLSQLAKPMTTKHGKVVTYREELPP